MQRFLILALAAMPFLSACQAGPAPDAKTQQAASATGATEMHVYSLWGKPIPADSVRMVFQHWTESGNQGAVVYGDGTAIWNRRVQHQVDQATVQTLLDAYEAADFRAMDEFYGEGPGIRARALASLRAGDFYKEVVRERQGGDDDPVRPLVARLMEILTPLEGGIAVDSLADGLEKIIDGELSPKSLTLVVRHLPASGEGWLLRAVDGRADWHTLSQQGNLGEPQLLDVNADWLRELAHALIEADTATLPGNLTTKDGNTQLAVQVLNERHTVLARAFTGSDADTDESAKVQLDELLRAVAALHAQAEKNRPGS